MTENANRSDLVTDHDAAALLDDPADPLMLKGMGPAPEGGWQVEMTGAHEVVLMMANSMREMLDEKDATNYVEAYFSAAGDPSGYYLNVRRAHGKSPHKLRQQAEERIAAALALAEAHDERTPEVVRGQCVCLGCKMALALRGMA